MRKNTQPTRRDVSNSRRNFKGEQNIYEDRVKEAELLGHATTFTRFAADVSSRTLLIPQVSANAHSRYVEERSSFCENARLLSFFFASILFRFGLYIAPLSAVAASRIPWLLLLIASVCHVRGKGQAPPRKRVTTAQTLGHSPQTKYGAAAPHPAVL